MSPLLRVETLLPLVLGLIWAAAQDIRNRKISNVTNVAIGLAGLMSWVLGAGWPGAVTSLLGLAIGFAIGILLFALKLFGPGDGKLLAAVGAWTGHGAFIVLSREHPFLNLLLAIMLAGSVPSLVVLLATRALTGIRGVPWERPKHLTVPYGVAIGLGTLLTVAASWAQHRGISVW